MTYRNVGFRWMLALAVVLGAGLGYQSLFRAGATVRAATAAPQVPCPVCNDNNEDTFDSCVNGECFFRDISDIPATVVFTLNNSGPGSLRAAIEAANNSPADDVITFWVNGKITLTTGELTIASVASGGKLMINGNGVDQTIISGNDLSRVFKVSSGADATFTNLTIEKGKVSGSNFNPGGGIYNEGTLSVTHSTISGNSVSGGSGSGNYGGGIYNYNGTLSVTHSTISSNSASGGIYNLGGGIYNYNGTLSVTHSTISSNSASSDKNNYGGGIYNEGTLSVTHSTISSNSVSGIGTNYGGGIFNRNGTLTVTHSTISGNFVSSSGFNAGGGIFNDKGTLTVTNSTISGNRSWDGSDNLGGGILNYAGKLILNQSTISGNSVSGSRNFGGGIFNAADSNGNALAEINNSTIANNTASRGGGLDFVEDAGTVTVKLRNTIIAQNNAPASPDVNGTITSQGYNLIGNNAYATITPQTGDQIGTPDTPINPQLAPLAHNGGPTQTHALLENSPARDAGDNCVLTNTCASPNPGVALTTDQRGTGFNRLVGDRVDIGAYEFVPPNTPPTLSYASNPSTVYGTALTITPTAGPSDDVSVASVQLISPPVAGISINSSGVISVAATVAAGSYPLQVQATDNEGGPNGTTTVSLTLTVNRRSLTVTVNPAWRNVNEANPPLTGSLTGLVNNDLITVSYSTTANILSAPGMYPITAMLKDPGNRLSNYQVTNTPGTLTVQASCGFTVTPLTMAPAFLALPYAQGLTVLPGGTHTFTLHQGSLPPGLQLVSAAGVFSLQGTPTTPGTYSFTLKVVKSGVTCETLRTYVMTIAPSVVPRLNCLTYNTNGTITAWFGYENSTRTAVTILVGLDNYFAPGAQNQGQVTTFQVGVVNNAFSVTYPNVASFTQWTVKGPDGIPRAVLPTGTSPRCP